MDRKLTPFFGVLAALLFVDLAGVASLAALPDWMEKIVPVLCVAQLAAILALIVLGARASGEGNAKGRR